MGRRRSPGLLILHVLAGYLSSPFHRAAAAVDPPPLAIVGNNGSPAEAFPLQLCQGDCDRDSECAPGLNCFQRGGGTEVPGCDGNDTGGTDYCWARPSADHLWIAGNNGAPAAAFPLGACEGDCDRDSECAEGLACLQRSAGGPVWGCVGEDSMAAGDDFCYDVNLAPTAGPTTYAPSDGPTLRPTRAPAAPTLDVPRPLEDVGNNWSPAWAFPLDACQGDCDADADCQEGLFCMHRNGGESVPGCIGDDDTNTDYCFLRPPDYLWKVGNNGAPAGAFPLGACDGDCDDDSECAEGLVCMMRSNGEAVYGCTGEDFASASDDFCYDAGSMPSASPTTPKPTASPTSRPTRAPAVPTLEAPRPLEIMGNNGDPAWAFPLDACQGDCDTDADCQDGLFCYKTNVEDETVPGCTGLTGHAYNDYCFLRPQNFLWYAGNNGVPEEAFPLKACEGDCDQDSDCADGLTCMQRSTDEHVWGCVGEHYGNAGKDFCFDTNYMPTSSPTTAPPTASPTLRPTRSPLPPTLDSSRPLELVGDNGDPAYAYPLDACQGDCDDDSDCQEGLMCFHSYVNDTIPGCDGVSTSSVNDYCFERPDNYLFWFGNNGLPAQHFPLPKCGGDCDTDDECAGDLKCFFFDAPEPVPGCVGPRKSSYDYCWDRPSNYLWEVGNNGVPASAFPLKECEGDCDNDDDCAEGLTCFHRTYGEPVYGCVGLAGSDSTDYCQGPTPEPTKNPITAAPSESPTTSEPTYAPTLNTVNNIFDQESVVAAFGCTNPDSNLWPRAFDGTTEKHVCDRTGLQGEDVGLIVMPSHNKLSVAQALRVYSQNDCSGCDPVSYILEGRSHSAGVWTIISQGDLPWVEDAATGRNARGLDVSSTYDSPDANLVHTEVALSNTVEYVQYKVTFTAMRNAASNSLQFAEVELAGVLYEDSSVPISAPDPFVQAIICPASVETSKTIVPGYKIAPKAPGATFCGVFIQKDGASIIPYTRSYNGQAWEASPGPMAMRMDEITCEIDCYFTLPPLEDANYVVISKDGAVRITDQVKSEIATFLEMITFGPKKAEIDALNNGSWGEAVRAQYIRQQMDMDATSHREYYRKRTNTNWEATTNQARSDHPCSPYSKWRRFSYIREDEALTISGDNKVTVFETVAVEAHLTTTIYEADEEQDVSAFGSGSFYAGTNRKGFSGVGYYNFEGSGDFLEFAVDMVEAGFHPISFRYMNGSSKYGGHRPCQLWVNDVMISAAYDFSFTGGYDHYRYSGLIDVSLNAGQNTIMLLLGPEQHGGPNIDHLRVGKPPAMVMKTEGYPRTVAKTGVNLLNDYFEFTNGTSVVFDDYPRPPYGDIFESDHGRIRVRLPDGSEPDLDIGNPPVDFTGYEQVLSDLPHGYITFDGTEIWAETSSDLTRKMSRRDQEVLLVNGLDDNPICNLIPAFNSESDAPVFGRLPDGSWLAWTPKVILETNGPSINAGPGEMTSNVLNDGGGKSSAETAGELLCSNVARAFNNEETCFLSTDTDACPSAEVKFSDTSGSGVIVCGSMGEVANDPSLHETFAIETEEHIPIDSDEIENQKSTVWLEIALSGPDQLRQRMAWALAQIITTVPENIEARDQTEPHINFVDMLVKNAFGNYRDILLEASFSSLMAEHLTYFQSKSHAYVYHDEDKRVSSADENYAREIMQLFTIGLFVLNDDGTPVLDPESGGPLETYTNEHIQSFARAWTGFDRAKLRGNHEQSKENRIDPMKIVSKWRDPFPKPDLDAGFIGDRYVLCVDLPAQSFLKAGAKYRLLGGSPLPELQEDPTEFVDTANVVLRAELSPSSALYSKLHNGGNYQLTVELDTDLLCFGIECGVDTIRVVKVGSVYYEFVERPCVQMSFYDNGMQIMQRVNYKLGTMCANPDLAHAREACCRAERYEEVRTALMETGVTYLYEGERMTYATAESRCVDYGLDLCLYEKVKVIPSDDSWRKGYHWTNKDCQVNVKVNKEGYVAIVHDARSTYVDNIPYHVEEENTLNWFRVFWNEGSYPGSSETHTCASYGCKTMESDESCLCKTTVSDSMVFTDLSEVSKEAVMSRLFVGALGPQDGSIASTDVDDLTVHMVGGVVDLDTVFEVKDKGRTFFLKNMQSTVGLEGWTMPPQIYEAEDATISFATVKEMNSGEFVELGTNSSSYVEWDVNVPNAGKYLVSFRYALDTIPKGLDVNVNGEAIVQQPANQEAPVVWHGSTPSEEHFPLQRCEGDCDSDSHCAAGLFCIQLDNDESIPGCTDNQRSSGDYCVDFLDFTNIVFLPTGGTESDWHYSKSIEVDLLSGSNTIRAQIPNEEYVQGPNLDHVRIEGVSFPSTSSFRNPPHFMSLIPEYDGSTSEVGEATIRDAQYETDAVLDNYFYHDNVAPFLCTRIIQRFGFSNPSPRYVKSCVDAFRSGAYSSGGVSFGSGKYGCLESMAAAIFLDAEATDASAARDPSHGSMREPILKLTNVFRSLEYQTFIPTPTNGPLLASTYPVELWEVSRKLGHGPYDFPSVFSWFLPEYVPSSGPNHLANLVSPESMVSTAPNIVNILNGLFSLIKYGLSDCNDGFAKYPGYGGGCADNGHFERSIGHLFHQPTGATLDEKIDDLALLLTAGRLSNANRQTIVAECSPEPDQDSQVRCMQQLIITTGEFQTTNSVTQTGEERADIEIPVGDSNEPYRAIVYYYLGGGLDSYNLLAPHTCENDVYEKYRTARGKSGISEGVGLPLSRLLEIQANNPLQPCSSFGVHENMPVLHELYNEGKLNFIANAGLLSKPLNRHTYKQEHWRSKLMSHNGMTIETKKDDLFDEFAGTGVGGRLADVLTQAGIPTDMFSIHGQEVLLTGVGGQSPSQYILNSGGLSTFNEDPSIENMEAIMRSLNSKTTTESGFFAETWSSKLVDIFDKQELLEAALENVTSVTTFPDERYAAKFETVTRIMQTAGARGSKRDIIFVHSSGFDMHSLVDERLVYKFSEMNTALTAFIAELKALNLWEQTVLVQFSEFGRTLNPNSGDGTDHAWGGNHFMFGGAVDGGKVLGKYPNNFEEGDEEQIMLSRGRMVPTTPWDAMWLGVAEWFGVAPNSPEMDKVLPLHKNFPLDKLFGKDELFDELGMNEGASTS